MALRKNFLLSIGVILLAALAPAMYFLLYPQYTFASDIVITNDDLGIDVNTQDAMFKVKNMAPGFTDNARITVINNGEHDFSYTLSTVLNNDDRMLFDGLLVEVKDSSGSVRYRGVMSGLEQALELGTIAPDQQEDYTIKINFPPESGNEYQGKTANVDFVFSARSHADDIEQGTGVVFEHPFINKNFALNINSTVPIKFHLVKPDGTLDNQERDVVLVISGPDANGNPQEYVFSKANGNLKFDGCLEKPHYIAHLSSFDYSLLAGGNYTAAVKSGDTVLGTREFMVDDAPGTSRSNSP